VRASARRVGGDLLIWIHRAGAGTDTPLLVSLLITAFLLGGLFGYHSGYRAFRKAFKLGVRDTLSQKSPDELRVFEEVLNELR